MNAQTKMLTDVLLLLIGVGIGVTAGGILGIKVASKLFAKRLKRD